VKSAGNDLIALAAVDIQRTILPNFYSKFIIPQERELYEQSSALKAVSFCNFVWLLWSVKESAYKYVKRFQPELIFSPSKFVVEGAEDSDDFLVGTVLFQDIKLYYCSLLTEEYIEAIVDAQEAFDDVYHEVIKIDQSDSESQSGAVRNLVLQKLKFVLGGDDLTISKADAGYPVIWQDGKLLDIPLSFAHHDCFVGYSFKL